MIANFVLLSMSVGFVFLIWKAKKQKETDQRLKPKQWFLWIAWLSIFSSLIWWSSIRGAEFGTTYWCLFLALIAWVLIFFNRSTSERVLLNRPYENRLVTIKKGSKSFATFFLAGPVSLVSSCLVTILVSSWLPLEQANQLVLAAFFFPILWSLLSFWICATEKRVFPTSVVSMAGILSGVIVFT